MAGIYQFVKESTPAKSDFSVTRNPLIKWIGILIGIFFLGLVFIPINYASWFPPVLEYFLLISGLIICVGVIWEAKYQFDVLVNPEIPKPKTLWTVIESIVIFGIWLFIVTMMTTPIRKPAVYLYPEETSSISVSLSIKGNITKSIPSYDQGWTVQAEPDGRIDKQYDYLFYEADLPNVEIPSTGWCIKYDQMKDTLVMILKDLGLNKKEVQDFLEYWIEALPPKPYYTIKLLSQDFLAEHLGLHISPKPDTLIRIMIAFSPRERVVNLKKPAVTKPQRSGFTVVEWGGLIFH
ncbi:MAG: hypothetical protein ACXACA_00745 [Candidatus Ranarchaeia archaeon]